jgi:hypothetical protein
MKITSSRTATLILIAVTASTSFAHGDIHCDVPKTEWQPQMALQSQLVTQGWRVRQVKVDNGCYEVYGFDDKGLRVEVYFNPKTFEKVGEIKKP